MGSNLLRNLVSGHTSWSKKVLWKKKFQGSRLRCLDKPLRTLNGSPILKLCLTALEHFKSNLYWIPGNGKNIRYWDDSILGDSRLGQKVELENIKNWLQHKNPLTLWDISTWSDDAEKSWESWNLGELLENIEGEASALRELLQGKSPLKVVLKNKRG